MFEIWLAPLQLIGCEDSGVLLLACPTATRRWVASRYAAALERVARARGRGARLATDRELRLLDALAITDTKKHSIEALPHNHQEAV